jgi:hypothetical protein
MQLIICSILGHSELSNTNISEESATSIFNVNSSTLKMESAGSSNMLVLVYQATRHHIRKLFQFVHTEIGSVMSCILRLKLRTQKRSDFCQILFVYLFIATTFFCRLLGLRK